MTRVVTITQAARFTAEIRGRRALDVLKRADVPRIFDYTPASGKGRCWTFPRNRLDDVLAASSLLRGVVVEVEQESLL